jgi:Maltokinase N-terminal cap domain
MAFIHKTTMTPGKLDLLASWLPTQPWYAGTEDKPTLAKAGGFRLDDPRGEVGIEFMVVTDESAGRPLSYHLPLTYRGTPLDGADRALVGTAEHGVLGKRWVYDGTHDPVLLTQLLALLQGDAEPQAQSVSDTPDPSVAAHFSGAALPAAIDSATVVNGPHGTDLVVTAGPSDRLTVHVVRVLEPDRQVPLNGEARGHVTADWLVPGGDKARARLVVLRDAAS